MSLVLAHPTLNTLIERLTDEGLIGLREAAIILKRHPSTVARWVSEGVELQNGRTIRLEAFRCGSKVQTSRPALFRFAAAQQS